MLTDIGIDPLTEISQNWWDSTDLKQHCAYKIQSGFFEEAQALIERIEEKEQELEKEPTKKSIAKTIKNA